MLNYVHRQFDAGPDADLVKDPSQSIFHVLLGDAQRFRYVAIPQAASNQYPYLNFFQSESIATRSVDGHRGDDISTCIDVQ
jgi:hypothetical protein